MPMVAALVDLVIVVKDHTATWSRGGGIDGRVDPAGAPAC
jgi:hypothetical protein